MGHLDRIWVKRAKFGPMDGRDTVDLVVGQDQLAGILRVHVDSLADSSGGKPCAVPALPVVVRPTQTGVSVMKDVPALRVCGPRFHRPDPPAFCQLCVEHIEYGRIRLPPLISAIGRNREGWRGDDHVRWPPTLVLF